MTRVTAWEYWYRDAGGKVEDFGAVYFNRVNRQTGLQYHTPHHQSELIEMLQERLSPALRTADDLAKIGNTHVRQRLRRVSHRQGLPLSWLPQNARLSIDGSDDLVVTLIYNNGLRNVAHLFFDDKRRLLEDDH